MTDAQQVKHLQERNKALSMKLSAAQLATMAIAEKLRDVTEERDRYFEMKGQSGEAYGKARDTLHRICSEAKSIKERAPDRLSTEDSYIFTVALSLLQC